MKVSMKSLLRQKGFTLVELMVVVAIIGLLSAVAIPSFKKYQAKAKVSEAKLQLSALYTAETAFYSDYNIYHTCLPMMGFDPGPEAANRYFVVGFGANATINAVAHAAAVTSGLTAAQCPANLTANSGGTNALSPSSATWFPAAKGVGSQIASVVGFLPTTLIGTQASAGAMTFTAGAGGVVSPDYTAQASAAALTMTQAKVISVTRNGF